MREIKFRGKRVTADGEWVYGVPVETSISGVHMVSTTRKAKGGKGGIVLRDIVVQHEVCVNTIGQFTGLKDRHGNEIYEGDIVQQDCDEFGNVQSVVVFEEGMFMLKKIGFEHTDILPLREAVKDIEIIGNIQEGGGWGK